MKHRKSYHPDEEDGELQTCVKYCVMVFCCPCYSIFYLLKFIWDNCLEKCLDYLSKKIDKCMGYICAIIEKIFNFIFHYIYICLAAIARCIEKVVKFICKILSDCARFIWRYTKPCIMPILHAIEACFKLILSLIAELCILFYKYILKPIGKCIYSVGKYIIDVGIEFGRLAKKYICIPIYKLFQWIYREIIKPIFRFIDYVIFKPIRWVLSIIGKILYRIFDFLDDIMTEICYDGYEYREKKRIKEEKKMQAQRKTEINSHKTQKYSRKSTNKQVPKEYVDFFGGNPDIATQYMQNNNKSPNIEVIYMQNQPQNPELFQKKFVQQQNNSFELPHSHSPKAKQTIDEEDIYICPYCKRKIPISQIESHSNLCENK